MVHKSILRRLEVFALRGERAFNNNNNNDNNNNYYY